MTARDIIREFPEFAKAMDGRSCGNTLLYFYELDEKTGVYEFLDTGSEEEAAELMGVELSTEQVDAEVKEDVPDSRKLTEEELSNFRDFIQDIRTGLTTIDTV